MTTAEKSEEVLKKILELINEDKRVSFERDWDGFTATILIDSNHTHVGVPKPDGNWEIYIDSLYSTLCEGSGLSWV